MPPTRHLVSLLALFGAICAMSAALCRADITDDVYEDDYTGHPKLLMHGGYFVNETNGLDFSMNTNGVEIKIDTNGPIFIYHSTKEVDLVTLTKEGELVLDSNLTNAITCGTNTYHVVDGHIMEDKR